MKTSLEMLIDMYLLEIEELKKELREVKKENILFREKFTELKAYICTLELSINNKRGL